MELTSFRVTNYRNILDSGDVTVGRVTSIVGQNECGKSNLLQALQGINPLDGSQVQYRIAEDWPIDRWPPPGESPVVCKATFTLSGTEIGDLFNAGVPAAATVETAPVIPPATMFITVSKDYANKLAVDFGDFGAMLKQPEATDFIVKILPRCVYMSDYDTFVGAHPNFPDLNTRSLRGQNVTPPERTLLIAMELAALDLTKIASADVKQRTYYTTAASGYLTRRFASLWKQKPVGFDIRVDGTNLSVFVQDEGLGAPIPLERRSGGFQWYVSFIWRFTHASAGEFKNCILLLDEPGIKLHHAGHSDLLEFLNSLSEKNTVIYTTHLSTMIDPGYPERIRILEVEDHHTRAVNWVVSGQRNPMMVIEARLGLSGSMSGLLGTRQNLIVEGVDDMLILQKLSGVLRASGEPSLSDRIYIIPAHGAQNTPLYAAFMIGNGFDAGVLVDSDAAGEAAIKRINDQRVPEAAKVNKARFRCLRLGKAAGIYESEVAIEDVFPASFYVDCVNEAYGTNLDVEEVGLGGLIAKRCEMILKKRGRIRDDLDKRIIMAAMQKRFDSFSKVKDLPGNTPDTARKLMDAINGAFA
jgi:energy-coupling factor transporter ATP-binding protein EcfA2